MQENLVEALHERQRLLRRERDELALEIAALQSRQSAVAAELSRVDGLIDFYAAPRTDMDGSNEVVPVVRIPVPVFESPTGQETVTPAPAEPAASAAAVPTATPPEGAWKAEAVRLLGEHGAPMHYKELYRTLATHGFVFGGRNPEAVLLTGVSREKNTFRAMGKGCYWIAGRPVPRPASTQEARPVPRKRRPRPIGHTRGRKGA